MASGSSSRFPYRMLYATSHELVDCAVRQGMNWVVLASSGHKGGQSEDDPPVHMPTFERLASARLAQKSAIEQNRKRVRALISQARGAGLKIIYHTYEPSMPAGFSQAYPQYYSKEISDYCREGPAAVRRNRNLCVARPEVRDALAAKVAEICRTFPQIDGFMYTNNESSSSTKVWHRCDHCRDIPFDQTMKMLHDAMLDGIRRSGLDHIRLFNRCWGTHDHDFHYWGHYEDRLAFDGEVTEAWLAPWVECFRPEHLHFQPSRDIPRYVRRLKGEQTTMVYKASWADTNLHHPLNPWIGRYGGLEEICELSFEYCRDAPRVFYIMGKEMQRRARLCRDKGVRGLCAVPICWGMHDARGRSAAHPSQWSLAELNIPLFAALCRDPDADLEAQTRRYLGVRYGRPLPAELARMLLDTEDVAAQAMNIRGVRATGQTVSAIYYSLLRYGPMRKNWKRLLEPTSANVQRVQREKAACVARAQAMLGRVRELKPALPAAAGEEFEGCLANLLSMVRRCAALHNAFMTAWSIRAGHLPPLPRHLDVCFSELGSLLTPHNTSGIPGTA